MHADLDQQDLSIVPTGHHVRGVEFIMPPRAKRSHTYQAYPNTLIPGGRRLDVPFRDPRFPIFWEVDRHPKLPADAIAKKCLVYWKNTNPVIMRVLHMYLKTIKIPKGHHIIEPRWYIFARDVQGTTKPEDDVLQVWVLDKSGMPTLVPAKFREMGNHNLGSRSHRTPNKPRHVKGQFTQDGIEWERHDLAKSPCAGTKICDDITAHNQMRAETVSAAADVGMCTLDTAPPELRQAADLQADLLNIALVKNMRNMAFPFMQMNMEELGKFGGKHVDGHDSDAGVTCMVTDSDIDEDSEEWGYFVICDLGIAIELRGFCVICFCGLCYHGGFTPTAKKGHIPKPWSYCYTIVLYPSAPLLEGTSQVAYAALPKNNEFPLAPEMILPRMDNQSTHVNYATWLHEGALFTPTATFLQWFFQTIVQIIFYFMRQIPSDLDVQVDFDHMAECFSVKDPANPTMCIMAQPWKNEAIQDHESFALSHRKFVLKALLLWEGRRSALHHFPSALSRSTAQALAEANALTGTSTVDRSHARKMGVRCSTRHNKPLPVERDSTHKCRSQMSHVLVKPLT
ncbi:hypothetical protein V8D89_015007 [Ganoderma adspersum]